MTLLDSGGRVFDGWGRMLEQQEVLTEGEFITRVVPLAEFEGFRGEHVDTTGCTLLLLVRGDPQVDIQAVAGRRHHRRVVKNGIAVADAQPRGC